MGDSEIGGKSLLILVFLATIILTSIFVKTYFNDQTQIVFCDVGQGDGAYIRIKNQYDILVDAGPDKRILDCLGKYMPFYDRTIELAILTHLQKDHVGGFIELLNRYGVKHIFTVQENPPTKTVQDLKTLIATKKIPVSYPHVGQTVDILDAKLSFFWPPKNFVPVSPSQENQFALVFFFNEKNKKALFTSDIDASVLKKLLQQPKQTIDILKIPHHGSKYGLDQTIFRLADIREGVISVGINNSYGHPAKQIINLLKALKINIRRTDKEGNIIYTLD